jgi:ABC-type siderophore export system fused ATPase/permease subunit
MQGTIIAIAGFATTLAGTLGGVVIGQRMSRSSQREQWLLDTTKQEYRELLSAFSTAHMAFQRLYEPGNVSSEQDQRQCSAVELDSYRVLRDRLYTAVELEREDIRRRWAEALVNFKDTKDARKFADRFSSICDTIVWLATDKKGERPNVV